MSIYVKYCYNFELKFSKKFLCEICLKLLLESLVCSGFTTTKGKKFNILFLLHFACGMFNLFWGWDLLKIDDCFWQGEDAQCHGQDNCWKLGNLFELLSLGIRTAAYLLSYCHQAAQWVMILVRAWITSGKKIFLSK